MEREKIIAEIEHCMDVWKTCKAAIVWMGVLEAAVEMLRNSPRPAATPLEEGSYGEPRVLTLTEIEALPEGEDYTAPVCVEERTPIKTWDKGSVCKWAGVNLVKENYIEDGSVYYNRENYGQTWRAWTGWPTAEERGKAAWS